MSTNAKKIMPKQAISTSGPVRENYKWVLLVFLFVAFFLELGSRQLYNAVLPQIRLEFLRHGVKLITLKCAMRIRRIIEGFSINWTGKVSDMR